MKILQALLLSVMTAYAATSFAVPSLQLGGDESDIWSYDLIDETWIASGTDSFSLSAYALDSAWDGTDIVTDRYAYLTVAATPQLSEEDGDGFDISIDGATLVDSGFGTPPLQDTNSVSPHDIFDTYFEIYEFKFDGSLVDVVDTQPGEDGTALGYAESFGITINSLLDGVTGVHFDLFTVVGDQWDYLNVSRDKFLVDSVAPYSHDAGWRTVPEPGVLTLLSIGLLGLLGLGLRRSTETS